MLVVDLGIGDRMVGSSEGHIGLGSSFGGHTELVNESRCQRKEFEEVDREEYAMEDRMSVQAHN